MHRYGTVRYGKDHTQGAQHRGGTQPPCIQRDHHQTHAHLTTGPDHQTQGYDTRHGPMVGVKGAYMQGPMHKTRDQCRWYTTTWPGPDLIPHHTPAYSRPGPDGTGTNKDADPAYIPHKVRPTPARVLHAAPPQRYQPGPDGKVPPMQHPQRYHPRSSEAANADAYHSGDTTAVTLPYHPDHPDPRRDLTPCSVLAYCCKPWFGHQVHGRSRRRTIHSPRDDGTNPRRAGNDEC